MERPGLVSGLTRRLHRAAGRLGGSVKLGASPPTGDEGLGPKSSLSGRTCRVPAGRRVGALRQLPCLQVWLGWGGAAGKAVEARLSACRPPRSCSESHHHLGTWGL